jgi:hypothetical protein
MLAQGYYHAAHAIIEESQPVKNRDLSRSSGDGVGLSRLMVLQAILGWCNTNNLRIVAEQNLLSGTFE